MRRRWVVALALSAIVLALVHPAYAVYAAGQAHATYIDMTSQTGWVLTSRLSVLASYLSFGAAAIATTMAALSRLWGRFALLLAVVLLCVGGLSPIGALAAYYAGMYLASIPVLSHTTSGEVAIVVVYVYMIGPQVVPATATLLWAAFPGQPRVPAIPLDAAHPPVPATASREGIRSVWGMLLLLACASGLLLISCLLLLSVRAH